MFTLKAFHNLIKYVNLFFMIHVYKAFVENIASVYWFLKRIYD